LSGCASAPAELDALDAYAVILLDTIELAAEPTELRRICEVQPVSAGLLKQFALSTAPK
jgi:hypothetical protein